jgi:hypothetical protein
MLKLVGVRPQMVDFGSGQGLSVFENAALSRKMPFVDGH